MDRGGLVEALKTSVRFGPSLPKGVDQYTVKVVACTPGQAVAPEDLRAVEPLKADTTVGSVLGVDPAPSGVFVLVEERPAAATGT